MPCARSARVSNSSKTRRVAAACGARAQLAVWYAAVRQGQGRHREAIEWAQRAIAEGVAGGDKDAEAHGYFVLDWAYMDLGELDRATNLPRASALYAELGDLCGQGNVLTLFGAGAYWRGDWNEAISALRAGQGGVRPGRLRAGCGSLGREHRRGALRPRPVRRSRVALARRAPRVHCGGLPLRHRVDRRLPRPQLRARRSLCGRVPVPQLVPRGVRERRAALRCRPDRRVARRDASSLR